jgi:hypothetical protein
MLNDSEKAAVCAVLTKYVEWYDGNAADRAIIAEANARIVARTPQYEKLKGALSLFGYQPTTEDFQRIRTEVGDEAFYQAQRNGGRLHAGPPPLPPNDPSKNSTPHSAELNALSASSPIREVVLAYLKSKAGDGAKASEIRAFIEKLRGSELHEKTVGMTLYRLSVDRDARRVGRTWFFVSRETENPGGGTPGLFNAVTEKE